MPENAPALRPTRGTQCVLSPGLVAQAELFAATPSTILIGGETGAGKTLLARFIHDLSPQRGRPFVVVNCGALSESLIESELFGHARGAFTGADRDRDGKLREAGDGTLVLDDLDCLPLSVQAKLLRVLEERHFEPVGSNRTDSLRARVIAASNRDLGHEAAEGRFRADLYYRINVIFMELPPLRDRRHDIPELARLLLGLGDDAIEASALTAMLRYDWPGNIRELRNVLERARIFARGGQITLAELPAAFSSPPLRPEVNLPPAGDHRGDDAVPGCKPVPGMTLAASKAAMERTRIIEALRENGNNRSRAAWALGISRVCLYKKIHHHGIPLKQPRGPSGHVAGPSAASLQS